MIRRLAILCSFGVTLLGMTALVHCSGGGSDGATPDGGAEPDGTGPVGLPGVPGTPPPGLPPPSDHRPTPVACPTARGAGIATDAGVPDSGIAGQCASDADCTSGTNGRCMPYQGQIAEHFCSYDTCSTDNDCADAGVCLCGTSINQTGVDGTTIRNGHRCIPDDCRVDGDCGMGGFCSPTFDTFCGPRNGVESYQCHTTTDTCTTDAQCADGGVGGYCAFQPTLGRWACSYGICAG